MKKLSALFLFFVFAFLLLSSTASAINESYRPYMPPAPGNGWYIMFHSSDPTYGWRFNSETQMWTGYIGDGKEVREVHWAGSECLDMRNGLVRPIDGDQLTVRRLPKGWTCDLHWQ